MFLRKEYEERFCDFLNITIMDINNIVDAVVGADSNGRCKTTIGFFVERPSEVRDTEANKLLAEFFVEKPIVEMCEFADAEGNEFISVEFVYSSKRDADLKQQWMFLERYVNHFINEVDQNQKPVLIASFLPRVYGGKHSILAQNALPDAISRTEYAGENGSSIKLLFLKDNVLFLTHDDDLIERQSIEAEVSNEIDEELYAVYGATERVDE